MDVVELDQVARCDARTADVVGHDISGAVAVDVQVDVHRRQAAIEHAAQVGIAAVDAHQDEPVELVVDGTPKEPLALGEEQEVVTGRAECLPQPHEHFSEERMLQIGMRVARVHDDADHLRSAANERPRCGVRNVVELADAVEDALPCLLAHRRSAVQDTGNRRNGDTAQLRHLANTRHFDQFRSGAARASPPPPSCILGLERRAREPSELERLLREPRAAAGSAMPPHSGSVVEPAIPRLHDPSDSPGHLHPQVRVDKRHCRSQRSDERRGRDRAGCTSPARPGTTPSAATGPDRCGSCRSRSASCPVSRSSR